MALPARPGMGLYSIAVALISSAFLSPTGNSTTRGPAARHVIDISEEVKNAPSNRTMTPSTVDIIFGGDTSSSPATPPYLWYVLAMSSLIVIETFAYLLAATLPRIVRRVCGEGASDKLRDGLMLLFANGMPFLITRYAAPIVFGDLWPDDTRLQAFCSFCLRAWTYWLNSRSSEDQHLVAQDEIISLRADLLKQDASAAKLNADAAQIATARVWRSIGRQVADFEERALIAESKQVQTQAFAKQLTEDIELVKQERTRTKTERKNLEIEHKELDKERAEFREKCEGIRRITRQRATFQQKMEDQQCRIDGLKIETQELKTERRYLQHSVDSKKEELEDAEKRRHKLQKNLDAAIEANAGLGIERNSVQECNATLLYQKDSLKNENVTLKEERDGAQKLNATLMVNNDALEKDNSTMKSDNQKLRSDISTTKSNLDTCRAVRDQYDSAGKQLRLDNNRLIDDLRRRVDRLRSAEASLEFMERKFEKDRQPFDELRTSIAGLGLSKNQMKLMSIVMKMELVRLATQNSQQSKLLEEIKQELLRRENIYNDTEAQCESLQKQLEDFNMTKLTNSALGGSVSRLSAELKETKHEMGVLEQGFYEIVDERDRAILGVEATATQLKNAEDEFANFKSASGDVRNSSKNAGLATTPSPESSIDATGELMMLPIEYKDYERQAKILDRLRDSITIKNHMFNQAKQTLDALRDERYGDQLSLQHAETFYKVLESGAQTAMSIASRGIAELEKQLGVSGHQIGRLNQQLQYQAMRIQHATYYISELESRIIGKEIGFRVIKAEWERRSAQSQQEIKRLEGTVADDRMLGFRVVELESEVQSVSQRNRDLAYMSDPCFCAPPPQHPLPWPMRWQMQLDLEEAPSYTLPYGEDGIGGLTDHQAANRKKRAKAQHICGTCYSKQYPVRYLHALAVATEPTHYSTQEVPLMY